MKKIVIDEKYKIIKISDDNEVKYEYKEINGKKVMCNSDNGEIIKINERMTNLYFINGDITQLVVMYKDSFRTSFVDTNRVNDLLLYDWTFKNDKNGGAIYCNKLKMLLHYYLYDYDKSSRDLRHNDGNRLDNESRNVNVYSDDEILPVGVIYNEKNESFVASFTVPGVKYKGKSINYSESFRIDEYGTNKAKQLAIKKRKEWEKHYEQYGLN